MWAFILRRAGHASLVVIGITTAVFFIARVTGDPVALMLPLNATHDEVVALRYQLGLDRPLLVQFEQFMANVARGDFGRSTRSGHPAMEEVLSRFPKTLYLSIIAMFLAIIWALPAGILAAKYDGSFYDLSLLTLSLVGQSMPVFWVGILLITIFGVNLKWFPVGGSREYSSVVLPAVSLAILFGSGLMRQVRAGMLETLGMPYVSTARAKGLAETRILYKHALRNMLLPIVTIVGLQLGTLLGGAVITETVFAWPGLGRLIIGAIGERDFPVVQAGVFIIALLFVFSVALTDLAYVALDPRVTYTGDRR